MIKSSITTGKIPGSTSAYFSHLTRHWLGRRWWALALPIAVLAIMGLTVDLSWLLVAMMAVFLMYPTTLMLILGQYALRAESRRWAHPCVATFTSSSLTIRYFPLPDSDKMPPEPLEIVLGSIVEYSISSRSLDIAWSESPYDFISIPHSSFSSIDDSRTAIGWIEAPTRHGSDA